MEPLKPKLNIPLVSLFLFSLENVNATRSRAGSKIPIFFGKSNDGLIKFKQIKGANVLDVERCKKRDGMERNDVKHFQSFCPLENDFETKSP